MKSEARAMAHELAKDSIVTDALAQFISQVIEELHKTRIAPAEARATAAEASLAALKAEGDARVKAAVEAEREVSRLDVVIALREWFGGERYARDYEYLDAQQGPHDARAAERCHRCFHRPMGSRQRRCHA